MCLRLGNTDGLIILMPSTDNAQTGKVSLVGCQRSHDPERGIPDPEPDLLNSRLMRLLCDYEFDTCLKDPLGFS